MASVTHSAAQIAEASPAFNPPARFDRVAQIYRAMEYLSFGPMLQRTRCAHLPDLANAERALVLGDGDGRFLARLLMMSPNLHADAVDASPVMLRLLRDRVIRGGAQTRLRTACADARTFQPAQATYDLIVTNFFLDCLTPAETGQLIARIRPHLAGHARWLVSEFQISPNGALTAGFSRVIIAALYAAFRRLTGMRVRQIPPWRELLTQAAFKRQHTWSALGGLLVSELWALDSEDSAIQPTAPPGTPIA